MNDSPYLVLAVATTGLFTETYKPKLLELAAVLVSPQDEHVFRNASLGKFHTLVKQPSSVHDTVEARQAQRFHGITPEMSENGWLEEETREAFRAWREGIHDILFDRQLVLTGWRAYNREFVQSILAGEEWRQALGGYAQPGRCVMDEASDIMGSQGVLDQRWDGSYRYPSLKVAGQWLHGRKHPIPAPTGRAEGTADTVAQVCLALRREHQTALQRTAP